MIRSLNTSPFIMRANKFVIGIIIVFTVAHSRCSKLSTNDSIEKVLIDTDAGGDDAVAIIMALETERLYNTVKVLGITCVNGNAKVNDVAMNVLKILKTMERLDVPVYEGAAHPVLLEDRKDYYFSKDGFGDFYYPDPPSKHLIQQEHAVFAMIDLVKAHPGEITLVALGPLTNIALAIRIYPSFLDQLQHLIIMGGSTEGRGNSSPGIEFNFFADPAANYVVFNSSTSKPVILVPYETTQRTRTTMEFRMSFNETNNDKVWLINSANAHNLKPEREYWMCADAAAMTVALTSGSCVTQSNLYYSEAIYDGIRTSGMVIVDYTNITHNAPNTKLIQAIDENVYKEILLRTFSN